MFFFDTCNAVAAREDRIPKYWRLGRRHLGLSFTLWRHTVKHDILNMVCDCWFPCSCFYWSLVKARKIVWESQVIDSSSITQSEALWVWSCNVTTSNSIQDGGALVVNILVFNLRVQLQHCCTYQRKTLLFALIKVSTFIYKRKISGLSSPLRNRKYFPSSLTVIETRVEVWENEKLKWEHEPVGLVFPRNSVWEHGGKNVFFIKV